MTEKWVLLVVDPDVRTRDLASYAVRGMDVMIRSAFGQKDAMEAASARAPDAALLALDLDGNGSSLSLARWLRRQHECPTVFYGSELSHQQAMNVASVEPLAFLCRPLRMEQLQATLRLALCRVRSPSSKSGAADRQLARALRQIAAVVGDTGVLDLAPGPTAETAAGTLSILRPREQEVVRLLFEHVRVPGIAQRLGISPQTVRNHLKHVFHRFGVHSQQELLETLRQTAGEAAGQGAALGRVAGG